MSAPYDPMRDPFFVIGDNDATLPLWRRALWRGVVVSGTTVNGQPENDSRLGYIFRHAVTIPRKPPRTATPPGGANNQPSLNPSNVTWGAFGFAVPVVAQGYPGNVSLMPMLGDGRVDPSLQYIFDAVLPDGTKEYLRGDSGVLVAGLDPDKERRVFISNRAMLYAHHIQPGATDPNNTNISTRVYDVDGSPDGVRGPWAGLHKALCVTTAPQPWLDKVVAATAVAQGVG